MAPNLVPFVLPDLRTPGAPMVAVPLKLPHPVVDRLQQQANRLRCSRAALARALVVLGLEQLDREAG